MSKSSAMAGIGRGGVVYQLPDICSVEIHLHLLFNYHVLKFNYRLFKFKGTGFQLNRTIIFLNQMYIQFNGIVFSLN